MDTSFLIVMMAAMVGVSLATIWLIKTFVRPSTAASKRRLTIFLRFIIAQYVILTCLALLSVEGVLKPRLLGVFGLANFVGSFLILRAALRRAPISDGDITREQRVRGVRASQVLIVIYVFALINGLLHIRGLPLIPVVVGVAVNILIVTALITNLHRSKAKLNDNKQ
jgi:hypothetical protein